MAESKSPLSETELKADQSSLNNSAESAASGEAGPKASEEPTQPEDPHAGLLLSHLELGEDLSEEILDQYLSASDPDFVKAVSEIEKDKALHAIDESSFDFEEWEEEKDRWIQKGGIFKKLALLSPVFPRLMVAFRVLAFRIKKQVTAYRVRLVNFLFFARKEGLPNLIRNVSGRIRQVLHVLALPFKAFAGLSLKQKALAFFGVTLLAGSLSLLWMTLIQGRVFLREAPIFLSDFSQLGQDLSSVTEAQVALNSKEISFFENPLVQRYQFLIEKLVVNLRRSDMSSALPMVAMELILESFSAESLARIKARESFYREIIQAETAKFTFDALETDKGKRELLANLQEALNKQLGGRSVASVHFKTIIVKP